jgi:predicted nucleic acid-binding protein
MKVVVLDSNEFIFAFRSKKEINLRLLDIILRESSFKIVIPSLILDEIFERMKELMDRNFASKVRSDILSSHIQVIDIDKVPKNFIKKYTKKGLKDADAAIAAFTEWVKADFLISENRHFLKGELKTDKFLTLTAKEFLSRKKT